MLMKVIIYKIKRSETTNMHLRKLHEYFCNCGEPIEKDEFWCLSCEGHYEGKYDNVAEYAIRGYEDNLIILQDSKGNFSKVSKEKFEQMENEDLVWHSFKGAIDYK